MPVAVTYRSGQAAKLLGVSAHTLRRLAEAGLVDADFTGSQWRFSVEEIQRLRREGLPPLPAMDHNGRNPGSKGERDNRSETKGLLGPPSEELVADTEDLRRQELALKKLRIQREMEEEQDFFREREDLEAEREADRRARGQETEQQHRRERERLPELQRKEQWRSHWIEHALGSMPYNAPEEMKLQVHKQVTETLARLNPGDRQRVVRQLVEAATQKALRPWRRQQEIQKIIEDALPYEIKYSDDKPRALRAAAEAVGKLRREATREDLELAAKEAIEPFSIKQEHEKRCERIVSGLWIQLRGEPSEVLDLTKEAVAETLKQLRVGCSEKTMEKARDQTLAPIKKAIAKREETAEALRKKQQEQARRKQQAEEAQRRKQEEEAQRKREAAEALRQAESRLLWRLGHVDDHLRKLDESEIEFESLSERWGLAEKFKKTIQPILVKELVQKPDLADEQIHEHIERLVDAHLREELDEDLEVEEAV